MNRVLHRRKSYIFIATGDVILTSYLHVFKLEGAHESAYLRQVLAFNAEKFRGSRDPSHASIWTNFWGSCPHCP